MKEQQAKERIEKLRKYYGHLVSFVAVNLFLFIINMMEYQDDGELWFVYVLFGWGIGMAVHTFKVFANGGDWEERKMQDLMGWTTTQEELEKLSERTDNLITILSSVAWDKIDPELLESKRNLVVAKERIVELRDQGDSESQAEVTREIEKLEEFVTSSKFGYYDLAAKEKE